MLTFGAVGWMSGDLDNKSGKKEVHTGKTAGFFTVFLCGFFNRQQPDPEVSVSL